MLSADIVSPLTDANSEAMGAVQFRPHRIPVHPKSGTGNEHKTPCLGFFFSFSSSNALSCLEKSMKCFIKVNKMPWLL